MMPRLMAAALCLLLALPCAAENATASRHEFTEPHIGTIARIVLYAADEEHARRAAEAGFARLRELDAVLSDYREDSELNRLASRAGAGPVTISSDLYAVLEAAQSLAVRSGGAFDATRGAVTRIWRQARRLDEAPDPARIEAALALGSYRDLQLDRTARTAMLTRAGVLLDVGGIAKGYVAEQALHAVADAGAPRAFVALGGDISLGAAPPGMAGWRVEVAWLDVPGAPVTNALLLHDVAISTAGDAEQWMEIDGVRHSHVLDARNGRPLTQRSTTTVIAPRGLQSDGLDTAASVLGPIDGLALVARVHGARMLMVRQFADGRVQRVASPDWPGSVAPSSTLATPSLPETAP